MQNYNTLMKHTILSSILEYINAKWGVSSRILLNDAKMPTKLIIHILNIKSKNTD